MTPDSRPPSNSRPNGLAIVDALLLCLLIVAMCSQINLGDIGRDTTAEGYVTKQLKIALPDIALFLTFLWFALRTTLLRAWKKIWLPPLPCWALLATLLIATLHSRPLVNAVAESVAEVDGVAATIKALLTKESKEAIAETIQFGGYFLLAPVLFVNLIHDGRGAKFISRRRLALWTFFASLILVALLAWWQLLRGNEAPRALFGSPNAFAGFCALALPLLLARLASVKVKHPLLTVGLSSAAILFFAATMVSVWAVIALLVALLVIGLLVHAPRTAFASLAVAGVLVFLIWPRQPSLQSNRLQSMRLSSSSEAVKKQFVEWYVGVARLADRREAGFATGAGPGNYQFNIGSYYARLPNEEKMPPDSNNLYLVQAINMGVLGLGALLWVIYHFSQVAFSALRRHGNDWLAAGVLASLTTWLIINCFHALIVRGTGVVLAFVLALAIIALQRNREPKAKEVEENRNILAMWMS